MSASDLTRAVWRKSSRSGTQGGNCVEVAEIGQALWQKSSRSNGQGGACVEIARNLIGVVAIRDSKAPAGPALVVGPARWMSFTADLKNGTYER